MPLPADPSPTLAEYAHPERLVTADWLFIATTAVFQPFSGLALAKLAGWPLSQAWLLWSAGLFVFAGLMVSFGLPKDDDDPELEADREPATAGA